MSKINMACIELTENEINAAIDVLRSGALRQGVQCDKFEQEFCEKTGARFGVTSSNGSSALHLAFMSFLEPDDEVLVPTFTFIATGSMATMAGGKPVFCDIDPETFLIDLDDARSKITDKTKAIAPVHLFGNPCDIEKFQVFAKEFGLKIVWDAAQAHGAEYKGADIGAFGDFVCYSFYPSKNMFVGEGGITLTDSEELAHVMRFMRTHGQTGKYLHTMLGLNYRMTDVEAAIGREQLKRLDEMLVRRRRNAAILSEGLTTISGITPQKLTDGGTHAWHQYCVRVDESEFGMSRDELASRLRGKDIMSGVHYPRCLHQQPIFKNLYGKVSLPVGEKLANEILALPVHHGMAQGQPEQIVEAISSIAS
ncbi:MAG: DegT/DnrJ/EryC1/StrS family aminotransferase [Oscillospiraceae bacterium]|nr:DegT/DnrJ/EryC1/StrS family aminotransferase [Oscillospiraceae bacterium]